MLLLVLVAVSVAFTVGVGLLVLYNVHPKSESEVLDSMTRDARNTTPAGSRENSVQRYTCDQAGTDSGSPTVVRVLDVDESASASQVVNEIGESFQNRHWSPTPGQVPGGISLERGNRFAMVTRRSGRVYIQVEDASILC